MRQQHLRIVVAIAKIPARHVVHQAIVVIVLVVVGDLVRVDESIGKQILVFDLDAFGIDHRDDDVFALRHAPGCRDVDRVEMPLLRAQRIVRAGGDSSVMLGSGFARVDEVWLRQAVHHVLLFEIRVTQFERASGGSIRDSQQKLIRNERIFPDDLGAELLIEVIDRLTRDVALEADDELGCQHGVGTPGLGRCADVDRDTEFLGPSGGPKRRPQLRRASRFRFHDQHAARIEIRGASDLRRRLAGQFLHHLTVGGPDRPRRRLDRDDVRHDRDRHLPPIRPEILHRRRLLRLHAHRTQRAQQTAIRHQTNATHIHLSLTFTR